jgi:hypothetical protein
MIMTKNRTLALLHLAADQIRADIAEYEAMRACIPSKPTDDNDLMARGVFEDLLRERRAMLARLDGLELRVERSPEAA